MRKYILLIVAALAFSACQTAQDELFELDFDRVFAPTVLEYRMAQTIGVGVIPSFTWVASPHALRYRVQFFISDTTGTLLFDSLIPGTAFALPGDPLPFGLWTGPSPSYTFRVMAISPDDIRASDSRWNTVTFQPDPEQVLHPLLTADVLSMSADLRWYHTPDIMSIRLTDNTSTDEELAYLGVTRIRNIPITEGMRDTAGLRIEDLNPSTQYTVQIFQDIWEQQQRGQRVFTTRPGMNCNWGHVLCFDFSTDPIQAGIELRNILQDGTRAETTIYLPEGFEAIITQSIAIAGTVHVFGNADGEMPRITYAAPAGDGIRMLVLPTSADSIVFQNVEIIGSSEAGMPFFYIVNQVEPTQLGTLRFENTVLTNFGEGGFRFHNGAAHHIENIIISNSIVSRFSHERATGRFAFIHAGNAGSQNVRIDNVVLRNSTFSDMSHSLLDLGGNTAYENQVTQSVTIENSTFDRVVCSGGARYLIQGQPWSRLRVEIRNSIFASTRSDDARGLQIHPESPLVISINNFRTIDWVTRNPAGLDFDIPELTNTGEGREDLFVNPNAGNFNFNPDVTGAILTAGDPRWRP